MPRARRRAASRLRYLLDRLAHDRASTTA
jgi:hypothetical protein